MFGLFKRKKPYEQQAWDVFDTIQKQSRKPEFYTDLGVPDTTEGRFDVLVLHMFMVMENLKANEAGQEFSQELFDVAFQNIDQGYREIGVGDMGIPKRMKKLMLGFNGRVHAYHESLDQNNDQAFKEALERNLYYSADETPDNLDQKLDLWLVYIKGNIEYLHSIGSEAIMAGNVQFKNLEEIKVR